ncbi:MAG: tyrosine/phenylalanine carboxypeptidase domain-containing protein [Polyangiales bacterium]
MSLFRKVSAVSSQSAPPSFSDRLRPRLRAELDVALRRLHGTARLLVGSTTHSDPAERNRLTQCLVRGAHAKPLWEWTPVAVDRSIWRELARARKLAEQFEAADLYLPRLEELETELLLLESLGRSKQVRPMAARLFGTGGERLFEDGEHRVLDAAHEILSNTPLDQEAKTIPATSANGANLRDLMLAYAKHVGLHIAVRVDPNLIANAAVGERTVFIADRQFGAHEAQRLATHEVYGHLVSGFNGRSQTLGVLAIGTAGSYGDQEGVAIYLEELAGLLSPSRRRTLAGRLLATHAMHAGVSFGDTARSMVSEHEFTPADAVTLCERAFRAGGVARDAVYLTSWLRVRRAVIRGEAHLSELQLGKVSLAALPEVRRLVGEGVVGQPIYLSNLARSLGRTGAGTRSATLPPSLATSLTRLDAT